MKAIPHLVLSLFILKFSFKLKVNTANQGCCLPNAESTFPLLSAQCFFTLLTYLIYKIMQNYLIFIFKLLLLCRILAIKVILSYLFIFFQCQKKKPSNRCSFLGRIISKAIIILGFVTSGGVIL